MNGWLDTGNIAEVRGYWPSADEVDLDELALLLVSAQVQCAAFAPDLGDDVTVPANYRHAQVLQARALYRAGMAGSNDQIGLDGQSVTVFPMDWTVKNLLRPKKGPWVK